MSKADRFREEIAWLKIFSGAGGAVIISLIAWLVRNYETANIVVTVAAIGSSAVIVIAVVAAVMRLYRCFKLLEDL